jgi:hypothetical protein
MPWGRRCVRAVPPHDNTAVTSSTTAGLCNNQTAFACGDCRPGYYKDNGVCTRCPEGMTSFAGNTDDKPLMPQGLAPPQPPAHTCRRYLCRKGLLVHETGRLRR